MPTKVNQDERSDDDAFELQTFKGGRLGDSTQEPDEGLSRRLRPSSDSTVSSTESFELYTPDEERKVVRKLDLHVVTFMSFLYLLSFLDRSSKCLQGRWPFK